MKVVHHVWHRRAVMDLRVIGTKSREHLDLLGPVQSYPASNNSRRILFV